MGTTVEAGSVELLRHLFVYGSLRIGGGNDWLLAAVPHEVERARIRGLLYDVPGLSFAALIEGEGEVVGELISMTSSLSVEELARFYAVLDHLEGFQAPEHPDNLYERRVTPVYCDPSEAPTLASVYFLADAAWARERGLLIPHGDWHAHLLQQQRRR